MLVYWSRLIVAFAAYLLVSVSAESAEIRVDPSNGENTGAVFEGRIEVGDFDKLKKFVLDGPGVGEIYLASPGGDLAEAIRVGLLVRSLRLSTVAPSKALTNESRKLSAAKHNLMDPKANYLCASACFFVFVAGIHRRSDASGPAILGIHRPSLSKNALETLSRDQIVAVDDRVRTVVDKYLTAMGVPLKYSTNMFSIPPKGVQWIRNDDFEHDLAGYIPELKDKVDAICDKRSDGERKIWEERKDKRPAGEPTEQELTTKLEEQLSCGRRIQNELALRAREGALKIRDRTVP